MMKDSTTDQWRGAPILWLKRADILHPHEPEIEGQVETIRAILQHGWDLDRVPPIPLADEAQQPYRALSGAHRIAAAVRARLPGIPCVAVPCGPGDYDRLIRIPDDELAVLFREQGMIAAAEATRTDFHEQVIP
ncbi:MAG: hypothetical protein HOH43_09955 [Candidatus Latescibacteria bacterium]|nr:hypothetical protein [Candidatus Latescibacterota bacterium]